MKQGLALGIAGLSIGWLAGLSVSPVIGILLTSIMSLAGAGIAVLQEIHHSQRKQANPSMASTMSSYSTSAFLVAALSCATAIGATAGVWARTHEWLGPTDLEIIDRWTQVGIPKEAVSEGLFQSRFAVGTESNTLFGQAVLFGTLPSHHCAELTTLDGAALSNAARAAPDETLSSLAENLDNEALAKVIKVLCRKD